jgi:hypothetical protein
MAVPNQIESIVKDELHALMASLQAEVSDPMVRANLLAMAEDTAMLPIRIARGEDVSGIVEGAQGRGPEPRPDAPVSRCRRLFVRRGCEQWPAS